VHVLWLLKGKLNSDLVVLIPVYIKSCFATVCLWSEENGGW